MFEAKMSRRGSKEGNTSRRPSKDRGMLAPLAGQLPQLSYPRSLLLGGDAPNGSPHRSKNLARFSQSLSNSPAEKRSPAWLEDDRALYLHSDLTPGRNALYMQSELASSLRDNIAEPLKAVTSPSVGKYFGGADSSMPRPQTISFPAAPTFWTGHGTPSTGTRRRPARLGASLPGTRASSRSRIGTGQARGGGHEGDDEGWEDPLGEKLLEEFTFRLEEVPPLPTPRRFLPSPASELTTLSHRIYSLISFRKSTPPQNRQLIVNYYEC